MPHPSARRAAEKAIADGASHPEAKQAALNATEQRAKDIDKIARHALYAVVYLIRDGGMRGSYDELDDDTWAEVIERIKVQISDNIGKVPGSHYEAAVRRLSEQLGE